MRGVDRLKRSISSGVDWFDLEGGVDFGDERVPWPEILRAAGEQRNYVTLGDGSRGMLPDKWLERWRLAALGDEGEDGSRSGALRSRPRAGCSRGASLASPRRRRWTIPSRPCAKGLSTPWRRRRPADAPSRRSRGRLRPYQRRRASAGSSTWTSTGPLRPASPTTWASARRCRSWPGSRAARRMPTRRRASLVVAPKQPRVQLDRGGRGGSPPPIAGRSTSPGPGRWAAVRGPRRRARLFVTTYGSLRRDALEALGEHGPSMRSSWTRPRPSSPRAARRPWRRARLRARRRVSLTGTPIENHLGGPVEPARLPEPGDARAGQAPSSRIGATRDRAGGPHRRRPRAARAAPCAPFMLRRTKEAVLSTTCRRRPSRPCCAPHGRDPARRSLRRARAPTSARELSRSKHEKQAGPHARTLRPTGR